MTEFAVSALLWIGALFTLIAAIGLIRFPDVLLRMHGAAKAGTVGVISSLIALTIHFDDPAIRVRAVLIALFMGITAPIVGQVLSRAALAARTPLCPTTHLNDWETDQERRERQAGERRDPGVRD